MLRLVPHTESSFPSHSPLTLSKNCILHKLTAEQCLLSQYDLPFFCMYVHIQEIQTRERGATTLFLQHRLILNIKVCFQGYYFLTQIFHTQHRVE